MRNIGLFISAIELVQRVFCFSISRNKSRREVSSVSSDASDDSELVFLLIFETRLRYLLEFERMSISVVFFRRTFKPARCERTSRFRRDLARFFILGFRARFIRFFYNFAALCRALVRFLCVFRMTSFRCALYR